MSTIVRYFNDGDETRRIVEHKKSRWKSTGPDRLDRTREVVRRWLTIERYDEHHGWVEERELGDYVEPKDAPHR